jgi:hypothetical protein
MWKARIGIIFRTRMRKLRDAKRKKINVLLKKEFGSLSKDHIYIR